LRTTKTALTTCSAARIAGRDPAGFRRLSRLAFHPENTALDHLPVTTGLTDIARVAVGRLLLDNFPHIKAYWQMLTAKIAQIALRFGADDLDARSSRRRFITTLERPRRRDDAPRSFAA